MLAVLGWQVNEKMGEISGGPTVVELSGYIAIQASGGAIACLEISRMSAEPGYTVEPWLCLPAVSTSRSEMTCVSTISTVLLVLAGLVAAMPNAEAWQFKKPDYYPAGLMNWTAITLISFDGADGNGPYAGLIFDKAGNLYGTTSSGGTTPAGTVFELSPNGNGTWTETVLYSFRGGRDGNSPMAGLVFDEAGNLYGTTLYGGSHREQRCRPTGCGTVFELSPATGGGWTETVLYRFSGGKDGNGPLAGLVLDKDGNLYGTTATGGLCKGNCGVVFKLFRSKGVWKESVLHSFDSLKGDGQGPDGGVIFDRAGNLYGTTYLGGHGNCFGGGCGIIFELTPTKHGWKEKILYDLGSYSGDAALPSAGVTFDKAGNLYGTGAGGYYGYGAVFEMKRSKTGWNESVIYSFTGGNDGGGPLAPVAFDGAGNLYGTTVVGGSANDGIVFVLISTNGQWTEQVLHDFTGDDGNLPQAGVIIDTSNNVYGTTTAGGNGGFGCGCGVAFEITP